ncbi:MAG: hypothetical protein ACI4I2_01380 [Oscillospiraceae bacterium]
MNFKARIQMFAKSVSVWFGIFLIIGCCIGFSINILLGFFSVSGTNKLNMQIFVPILIAGAAVLAVGAHFLSAIISKRPEMKMRAQLDKTAAKNGIGREYIEILNLSCRGNIRTKVCSELSLTALVTGNFKRAKEQLDRVDAISVTDIANSTGNYSDAAYYFSTSILYYGGIKDYESMENTYIHAKQYTENLTSDFFAMSVRALCEMRFGSKEAAAEALKTADFLSRSHIKSKMPMHKALCAAICAEVHYRLGEPEKAFDEITEAMNYKISTEFTDYLVERGKEIKDNPQGPREETAPFDISFINPSDFE